LEYLEYTRNVRLDMEAKLKNDILIFKKRCFEENINLIRSKTTLKELSQKNTTKKHMSSRCKLVLNSLQQTVKVREEERQHHLKEVSTILVRKYQNT
jgi:hypothetical protein